VRCNGLSIFTVVLFLFTNLHAYIMPLVLISYNRNCLTLCMSSLCRMSVPGPVLLTWRAFRVDTFESILELDS
jgi:hypothetical protein